MTTAEKTYRGMSVNEGAAHVMKQLSPAGIEYAAAKERGEYRGFAALGDLYDHNMFLPFVNDDIDNIAAFCDWCNDIILVVTAEIIARSAH